MAGTSSVPNVFAAQSGLVPASQLDANWNALTTYINAREVSSGTLAARPAGVGGQWYYATTASTLYFHSGTGGSWIPVPASALFNVRSYGATGNGVTDDTTAIQAAIDAAAANGGTVYVPGGIYIISRLNLTGLVKAVIIRGDGINASRFMPLAGTASYGTTTGHLFDCTGSNRLVFQDFQVGAFDQTPEPTTAFFIAASSTNNGDQVQFRGLHITGKYTVATLYVYGVASSQLNSASFWNYKSGAGVWSAGTFTATNVSGLASSFATVATGTQSTSDWTGQGVEFHKLPGAGATGAAVILDAVGNLTWLGGNWTGGATNYIQMYGTSIDLSLLGVTFQTESEPVTPTNLLNIPTSASLIGCSVQQLSTVVTTFVTGGGVLQMRGAAHQLDFGTGPGASQNIAAGATVFLGPTGAENAEIDTVMIAAQRGLVTSLQAHSSTAPTGTQDYKYTFRNGLASTTLTATITGAATSAFTSSAYVSISQGAVMAVQLTNSAAGATARMRATVEFTPLSN